MTDEDNNDVVAVTDAQETVTPVKKTRQSRKAKAAAEAAKVADVAASDTPVKKTRAKRGSKSTTVEALKSPGRRGDGAPAAAASDVETSAPATAIDDDFADLIKLEEENRSLRRELSEKLRAENENLRKRLGKN